MWISRQRALFCLVLYGFTFGHQVKAATCLDLIIPPTFESLLAEKLVTPLDSTCGTTCSQEGFFKGISQGLENAWKYARISPQKIFGFTVIISSMIASAAASSAIISHIPEDAAFLIPIISSITAIGIYEIATPIKSTISGFFNKLAFKAFADSSDDELRKNRDSNLQSIWLATNSLYTLNEQMAINRINAFLLSAQNNFALARDGIANNDSDLTVDVLTDLALRTSELFLDVPQNLPTIKRALEISVLRSLRQDQIQNLKEKILEKSRKVKPDGDITIIRRILEQWFQQEISTTNTINLGG